MQRRSPCLTGLIREVEAQDRRNSAFAVSELLIQAVYREQTSKAMLFPLADNAALSPFQTTQLPEDPMQTRDHAVKFSGPELLRMI